jgi:hypothetical protein
MRPASGQQPETPKTFALDVFISSPVLLHTIALRSTDDTLPVQHTYFNKQPLVIPFLDFPTTKGYFLPEHN